MIKAERKGLTIKCKMAGTREVVFAEFISLCRGMAKEFSEDELLKAVLSSCKTAHKQSVDVTEDVAKILHGNEAKFGTAADIEERE